MCVCEWMWVCQRQERQTELQRQTPKATQTRQNVAVKNNAVTCLSRLWCGVGESETVRHGCPGSDQCTAMDIRQQIFLQKWVHQQALNMRNSFIMSPKVHLSYLSVTNIVKNFELLTSNISPSRGTGELLVPVSHRSLFHCRQLEQKQRKNITLFYISSICFTGKKKKNVTSYISDFHKNLQKIR